MLNFIGRALNFVGIKKDFEDNTIGVKNNSFCHCCHCNDFEYGKKSDGWDHFEVTSSASSIKTAQESTSSSDTVALTSEQKESMDNLIEEAFDDPANDRLYTLSGLSYSLTNIMAENLIGAKSQFSSAEFPEDESYTYSSQTKDDGTEVLTRTEGNGDCVTVEKSTDGTTTATKTQYNYDGTQTITTSTTKQDGSKVIIKSEDGVEVYRNEINTDGSYTVTENGEVTKKLEIKDDGTKVKTEKGTLSGREFSQVEEIYTDGSSKSTRTYNDGDTVVREKRADGYMIVTSTQAGGFTTVMEYNTDGTIVETTKLNGAIVGITTTNADGSKTVKTYTTLLSGSTVETVDDINSDGKKTKSTTTYDDNLKETTEYNYGDNGKLSSETTTDTNGETSSVKYSYNSDGTIDKEDHGSWYYKYEYDSKGRIITRRKINHGDPIPEEKIEYTYNTDNSVSYRKVDANGSNLIWNWTTSTGTANYDDVNDVNEHVKNGY